MFDYIQKHLKLVFTIAILTVLVLISVALFVNRDSSVVNNGNNGLSADGLIIDGNNQFLLDEEISDEDKYIMLLSQEMTEIFGTYQKGDFLPLQNLLNQSTDLFAPKIRALISANNSIKDVITTTDSNSITVNRMDNFNVSINMDGITTDNVTNKQKNIRSSVKLIKIGGYWLVDNIDFQDR